MDRQLIEDPVGHAVQDMAPLFDALEAVYDGAPADAQQLDELIAAFDEAWGRVRQQLAINQNPPPVH